jgi:hypothetical protein
MVAIRMMAEQKHRNGRPMSPTVAYGMEWKEVFVLYAQDAAV